MVPSFHNADKPAHRRVMVVGLLFCCLVFVVISFSLEPQAESGRALIKADRPVHTDVPALNGPEIFPLAICDRSRWR